MNLEMMETRTQDNVRPVIVQVERSLAPFVGMRMTPGMWNQFLGFMFGFVSPAARAVAEIARSFYDAERERALPRAPRHEVYLANLTFDRFVRDMEPVRSMFVGTEVTEGAVHHAALRAARTVENTGRWTIMQAVETPDPWLDADDDDIFAEDDGSEVTFSTMSENERREMFRERDRFKKGGVRGWARVATGRETCGWCLMLVSRGAVYHSAKDAGSKLDDRSALKMQKSGQSDPESMMNEWHAGCDCKVVPVFDLKDWSGRDRYKAAEQMWKDVTRGYSGKDAVNAFRRAAEAGRYPEYLN